MSSNRIRLIERLIEALECLSDRSYQERVWIRGEGPEIDDYDEAVCEFSFVVDIINESYRDYGLTDIQHQALNNYKDKFDSFSHGLALDLYLPINFIDTEEWDVIMNGAKELLQILHIDEIIPRIR